MYGTIPDWDRSSLTCTAPDALQLDTHAQAWSAHAANAYDETNHLDPENFTMGNMHPKKFRSKYVMIHSLVPAPKHDSQMC